MHDIIDKKANEKYDDWCKRKGAIFAWPVFEKAQQYSKNFVEEGIVEIDLKQDANPWCIEEFVIEDTYHEYLDEKNLTQSKIEDILEWSREWERESNSELEVWFRPEDVEEISAVYDSFGNAL